ncbi:hypothetical protein BPY_21610 [Bifidobacterium psychraerophilum]|uniref:hypothetical protein n=1 Tax=Bifidobacterium psychraerophilum TaxID=218140 RepID=UPI003115654F
MAVTQQESSEKQEPSAPDGTDPRSFGITDILVTVIQTALMLAIGLWLAYVWSWFSIVACIVMLVAISALFRFTGAYKHMRPLSTSVFAGGYLTTIRQILIMLSCALLAYAAGRIGPPQGWNWSGSRWGWLSITVGIIGALSNIPSLITAITYTMNNQSA